MNKETEQMLAELERIVVERQDWLFRFAYMRIGIREDAEDVVQEVLLSVFRRLREKASVDSVEQYVIRAISNALDITCFYMGFQQRLSLPYDSYQQ